MKTLDEVIKAMEFCLSLDDMDCGECPAYKQPDCRVDSDALHYLKLFKADCDRVRGQLEDLKQEYRPNTPLTWDELRQMEGKPVWIEAESLSIGVSPYWNDWYIIKSFSNDEFMCCNDGFEWAKERQGRLWQAYRKER